MNTNRPQNELLAMAEALEWVRQGTHVSPVLRARLNRKAAELRAAETVKDEPVAPTAYIERITGRLAAPYDDHRCRFPMVYDALYIHPDPRVAELEALLRDLAPYAPWPSNDPRRIALNAALEGKS